MKIKILGNGGAINDGLPYNSFIINDNFLVESPPDIMNCIFKENVSIEKIKTIYISHFHADHYFGLPFLFLRLFFEGSKSTINVIGPQGIEDRVKKICILAFDESHPMQQWIESNITFTVIENTQEICVESIYKLQPIEMFHFTETYGFIVHSEGKKVAYLADTYWHDSLLNQIEDVNAVIVDLNGEKTDRQVVHISENDLIKHALPRINNSVTFYGTHLKKNKKSDNKRIQYLKSGDELSI